MGCTNQGDGARVDRPDPCLALLKRAGQGISGVERPGQETARRLERAQGHRSAVDLKVVAMDSDLGVVLREDRPTDRPTEDVDTGDL
jgi:hypothetical protein